MSDSMMQESGGDGAPATSWITPGGLLRQARLQAGVHVDTLAAALKVPVYKLEALEEDRLDVFPDAVFVRALASSICRTLKVDATPVLELLPQGQAPRLSADKGINAAFKDGHGAKKVTSASLTNSPSGSRWIPAMVVVLLLAALALVFLPRGLDLWRGTQDARTEMSAAPAASAPVGIVEEPVVAPNAAATVGAGDGPAMTGGGLTSPVAAASAAAAAVSAPVVAPPAVSGGEVLVVRARGETWVQIRNLVGGSSVQRVLQAGDSLVAQGEPPWAVVIGKAAVTDVMVRGERLDLTSIARDNVARFEVK